LNILCKTGTTDIQTTATDELTQETAQVI